MKDFFKDVKRGEIIRISSGEGYWEITGKFEEALRKISTETRVSIILGPIVCVEDSVEKRSEGNPYFRLRTQKNVAIYCAPCRQRFHYKIKGEREVLKEEYHRPLEPPNNRKSTLIKDPIIVKKYVDDYELFIKVFEKDISKNTFVFLRKNEIEQIKGFLKKESKEDFDFELKYDFLTYDEIVKLLKDDLKIFCEDMIMYS